MITIYHNPRCTKSRGACDLVTNAYGHLNEPVKVIEYLREPLTVAQLKDLHRMLGRPVRDMLRNTESEYKELGLANPELTDEQLLQAIAKHPILLQRPIVVRNGKAVIGRPPENVEALFGE
jgi:arsenate reductase